jgi:hypothetical protein
MNETTDFLTGPWEAVLADIYGHVYGSIEQAVQDGAGVEDGMDYDDFAIYVVRNSALPRRVGGNRRMPPSYCSDDAALHDDDFLLVNVWEPAEGGAVHLARAQAMAAGLNAAWKASA